MEHIAKEESVASNSDGIWFWPEDMDLNDFPDPVGFESAWNEWRGDLADGPGPIAEVFAREFIQNSWDAIQANANMRRAASLPAIESQGVSFYFIELNGEEASIYSRNFGLYSLKARYATFDDAVLEQKQLDNCFLGNSDGSIRLLLAVEHGATGMYGVWDTKSQVDVQSSLMRHALLQTTSEKPSGTAGGSWGHGKQGVAQGSRVRTIAAYTCFDWPEDRDVPSGPHDKNNLFLTATYWPRHALDGKIYKGLGLVGQMKQGAQEFKKLQPLEGSVADGFIRELGVPHLDVRDPSDPRGTGTTFMILDPNFEPSELVDAIERNWWPMIERRAMSIEIFDYDGNEFKIDPRARGELRPFIEAFEVARQEVEPADGSQRWAAIVDSGNGRREVGRLGLTSDTSADGWSWNKTPNSPNACMVALVRNDMVIAYLPFPAKHVRSSPYVRGAFVVDRAQNDWADKMLRLTEPHLHNEWSATRSDANSGLAKRTINSINEVVRGFRKGLLPEEAQGSSKIPAFSALFKIRKGTSLAPPEPGPKPPPPLPTDFSVTILDTVRSWSKSKPGRLSLKATATIEFSKKGRKNAPMMVAIAPGWRVLEETAAGVRDDDLIDSGSFNENVSMDGFSISGGIARGLLTATPITISWTSQEFDDDWIVTPDVKIEDLSGGDETEGGDE